ncbi:MAG: hypothetical protein GY867_02905 [bacterium]|nr:hypothetical protein [bacterium]
MIRKAILLGLVVCIAICAGAHAGERHSWGEVSTDGFDGPRHQAAISVGFRTDETERMDAQPEIALKFIHWFSRHTAFTSTLGFTNETAFSPASTAMTWDYSAALRVQQGGRIVALFFEPGLSLSRHTGDLDGSDFSETGLGISLSAGVSLGVGDEGFLDISLRQVLNDAGSRPIYATSPLPYPPVGGGWEGMGGADTYDLHNPTHFVVFYRFGL